MLARDQVKSTRIRCPQARREHWPVHSVQVERPGDHELILPKRGPASKRPQSVDAPKAKSDSKSHKAILRMGDPMRALKLAGPRSCQPGESAGGNNRAGRSRAGPTK